MRWKGRTSTSCAAHTDGQLCEGHLHEFLDDARACIDRTKLDGLWQDLARNRILPWEIVTRL